MTDILTKEELQKIKKRLPDFSVIDLDKNAFPKTEKAVDQLILTDLPRVFSRIEALQAQNKRLVEALEPFACTKNWSVHDIPAIGGNHTVYAGYKPWQKPMRVLSLTPAEALEAERRREEVIRAAIALYDWQGSERLSHAGWRGLDFINAVEGVKALEGV